MKTNIQEIDLIDFNVVKNDKNEISLSLNLNQSTDAQEAILLIRPLSDQDAILYSGKNKIYLDKNKINNLIEWWKNAPTIEIGHNYENIYKKQYIFVFESINSIPNNSYYAELKISD